MATQSHDAPLAAGSFGVGSSPLPLELGNLLSSYSPQLRDDEAISGLAANAVMDLAKIVQDVPRHVRAEWDRAADGSLLLRLTDAEELAENVTPQTFTGTITLADLSNPRWRRSRLSRVWRDALRWRGKELWQEYLAIPYDASEGE